MKYVLSILLILTAIAIFPALASDVTLKTSQSTYTFPSGEEARVPFVVESSFQKTNVGTLAYTLTRKESQGGFSFSQSSSQSQSFPISPGSSQNAITLSSEEPAEFEVSLSLQFRNDGRDYVSTLPPFTVIFAPNQIPGNQGSSGSSQSSGQDSPLSSTTSEVKQNTQGQSQDPFAEMDQQMNAMRQQNQQLMQQMLSSQGLSSGSGSRSQPQNAQQALQNNQMNAQSSALQQQLEQETSQNKQDQQDLAQQMKHDPLLNQINQDLQQAGYEQKDGSLTAQGKGSGSVSAQYNNEKGQSVSLEGQIENGSVQQLTASSNESVPIPSLLQNDPRYQAARNDLQQAGYNQTGGLQSLTPNETRINEQYNTPDGKNATVSSVIRNGTVESVTVQKNEEIPPAWYIGIILLILLICLCSWAAYRYYQKRNMVPGEEFQEIPEPPDIREATEKYLIMAEIAVKEGRIKDAYASSGQGLRFFISHTKGSGSADTTEEILVIARKKGMDTRRITPILERCIMIEYARSDGSAEEIREFIKEIRSQIADQIPPEFQQ